MYAGYPTATQSALLSIHQTDTILMLTTLSSSCSFCLSTLLRSRCPLAFACPFLHVPIPLPSPIPFFQYLNKQNRPYNATDLQANLKAKFNISKPAVVKALASLAQKGEIVEKTYGKQVIYAAKQPEEDASSEDMEKLRADLTEKKLKLKELNDAQKELAGRK